MAAWNTVKLSAVCEIQRGGSPRPIEQYMTDADNGINWIKIGDVAEGAKYITSTREKIRPEGVQRSREVSYGDFLLSNSMSFGRPYILRTSGCIHDGWLVLRYDKTKLTEDFLYHVLSSDFVYAQFVKFAVGAVVKNLNSEIVKNVAITLPPLTEQRRIAAILDQADALRAKRLEALAQLDSLTQSIFTETFGDPDENIKGLPIEALGSLCQRITDGTHQSPKWETTGIPFLFISNIVDGQITFDTHKYISEETYLELTRRCPIEFGDVLYTTVGSYGNAAVVATNQRFAFQRHIAHIKPNMRRAIPSFVAAMIQSSGVRRQVDKVAKGVAQKTVNLADLKSLLVFAPSLAVQQTFAARAQAVEVLKST